jgi:uncharacterized protein YbjT (DUF2867 family)
VIDAAKRAGVSHVVKQTVLGADPNASIAFGRWHGQVEQYLAQSGLAYTLVQPRSFMRYRLTGPEALSAAEVAERLSAAIGRPVRHVDLPADAFAQGLAGAGMPGWLVDAVVEGNTVLAAGDQEEVTDAVARVTGRPPRTFEQFAIEHRTAFGGQPA